MGAYESSRLVSSRLVSSGTTLSLAVTNNFNSLYLVICEWTAYIINLYSFVANSTKLLRNNVITSEF